MNILHEYTNSGCIGLVFAGIIETFVGRKYAEYFKVNFSLISTGTTGSSSVFKLPSLSLALIRLCLPLKGLMESWSNVSGNYCYIRRNSRRSDTAVHCSSALLL